jgi:hypothetical protein
MLLSGATYADAYHDWMNDHWETIKNEKLSELVIPGTHDSGTYDLSFGDSAWADSTKQALNELAPSIAQGYAETQSQTIYEQLMSGARILDLRFEEIEFLGQQNFRIHHSYLGPTYAEIFADIRQFLEESGHEKEIVVLKFSHMQSAVNVNSDGTFSKSMPSASHRQFIAHILREFGPYMMKTSDEGFAVTPKDIHDAEKQIIVLYGATTVGADETHYITGKNHAGGLENLVRTQQESGDIGFLDHCPRDNKLEDVSATNLPECEKLFWTLAEPGSWFSKKELFGGTGDYPSPTNYGAADLLENKWLRRVFQDRTSDKRASMTSLAMGLDTPGEPLAGIPYMIFNNTPIETASLGFSSLEEAAAYTNPRLVPHLIAIPKNKVNFVMVDYFQSSGLVQEAIKLNADPARVSVRIKSVRLDDEISECGPGSGFLGIGDEDCDMYPNLAISEGTPITSVGDQTENYRVAIPDKNSVYRNSHFSPPYWSTTKAIPWNSSENLTLRIQVWDDDYPLGEDVLDTVTHVFQPGYLAGVRDFQNGCDEEYGLKNELLNTEKYSIISNGRVKIVYDYVVQAWNNEMDAGCTFNAEWTTPGDMEVSTDPGKATALVNYEVTPPSQQGWELLEFACTPTSGTEFDVGETLVLCGAEYRKPAPDGEYEYNNESTSFRVTVIDDEPPTLVPPPDISAEATGATTFINIGSASAVDNVDGSVVATNNRPGRFPLGTTIVVWTATDAAGNTATAQQSVTVVDTTAPVINSLSATPSVLWSPNKTMRPVEISVTASDLVDNAPSCELVDIQSNQGAEPGNKRATLYEITGASSALLLADRSGKEGDRLYTLHVSCTDFTGNASSATTDVVVPHDRRR